MTNYNISPYLLLLNNTKIMLISVYFINFVKHHNVLSRIFWIESSYKFVEPIIWFFFLIIYLKNELLKVLIWGALYLNILNCKSTFWGNFFSIFFLELATLKNNESRNQRLSICYVLYLKKYVSYIIIDTLYVASLS